MVSLTETVQNVLPDVLPEINGLLEIPEIDLIAVVIHGVTEEHLRRGPGFYAQSSHPEVGNVSIAAHRGGYGSWFRNINRLMCATVIRCVSSL
ncbi:MAG: sortase [Dethiobacter sp.]|nr:sortase [Dethiobacter sp.]